MKITHQIKIDMARRSVTPVVDAVQGDTGTRSVDISLFANDVKWDIPAETLFLVKYRREDGTGGTYDTLPDGSLACSTIGNTVSVVLVSPILSKSGIVETQIEMNNGENVLSVFTFFINVQRDPAHGADIAEDDYVNIQTFIKSEVETALTAAKESGEFDGPAGKDGKNGADGEDGKDGKSAYQYAKDGGFTGTEGEFSEKLAREYAGYPSVSVTDYGAKGDGSTNDTKAFQTAIENNRVVFVPGGDYVLSDTLVIRANCCLELSQDTVLRFTQTDKHGITMLRLANLKGNHATIFVPYTFSANVINCDGGDDYALLNPNDLANSNATAVPPFVKWDPQWKMSRYVTDINICKPNSSGFNYSNDGTCYGNGIYVHCNEADWPANYMWGVNMSGVRIAGGFNYGIRIYNIGEHTKSWSHDMRIEAVIDACKIGVSVENAYYNRLAVTIQPRPAADGTAYAEHGVEIIDSKGVDLSSSRVWDWMKKDDETGKTVNSKWEIDNEFQHIAMYGDCRGLILDDFIYYAQSTYDIRDLIYTDTPSNLEKMTILQEPITRWFKTVDGEPYFNDGHSDKKLVTKEELDEHFVTDTVQQFTDVLATAVDTDGTTIYNGIGYKMGCYLNAYNNIVSSAYYGITGFIPVKVGSKIYTNDLTFAGYLNSDGTRNIYTVVTFFDSDRNPLPRDNTYNVFEYANAIVEGTSDYLAYEETDNGFICTVKSHAKLTNLAYVRFSLRDFAFGAKPMISIDEEIEFKTEGFLADGIKVKGESVVLTSPSGNSFVLSVSDSGALSTIEYAT